MQSEHVGMWVEYAWVNDRVLGRRRGAGPDVRSVVSWSNEKRGAVVLPVLSRQPWWHWVAWRRIDAPSGTNTRFVRRPAPSWRIHSPGSILDATWSPNQEIFKLRGTYQHSPGCGCKASKRHLAEMVVNSASSDVLHEAPIVSRSQFSMMSLTSSVASPAVVVVMAIVDIGRV